MGEGDGVSRVCDGPLAGIDEGIGEAELVGRVVDFAQDADARFDEEVAGFRVGIAYGAVFGAELFDGAGDGVVGEWILVLEPFTEELVTVVGDAGDDAGPVEARGSVVAIDGIRQEDQNVEGAVGEKNFWVVGVWDFGARGRFRWIGGECWNCGCEKDERQYAVRVFD